MKTSLILFISVILISLVVFTGCGNNGGDATQREPISGPEIYAQNVDAAFTIWLSFDGETFGGNGAGFFIRPCGLAVTNHHVLYGAVAARVVTNAGNRYDIIGYYVYDLNNDVALIRVDTGGREVPYMTIGDSEAMRVGEDVFALGSPLGMPLVFSGGNLSRLIDYAIYYGRYRVYDTMQFTAPISGGNSGGPLFNNRGEVIGVNSAGVPGDLGQNLNFAVRIERAMVLTYNDHPLNPLPMGGAHHVVHHVVQHIDLVGNWFCVLGALVLNDDGTGKRLGLDGSFYLTEFVDLTWKLSGGILSIESVGGNWDWAIDILHPNVFKAGGVYFIRVSERFDITGTWLWHGGYYTFNADGTGTRDWDTAPGAFRWTLIDDILSITSDGNADENWSFSVVNEDTMLIAEQEFIRDVIAFDMTGEWHFRGGFIDNWRDEDARIHVYNFNSDGTGTADWRIATFIIGYEDRPTETVIKSDAFHWEFVGSELVMRIADEGFMTKRVYVIDTNIVLIGLSVYARDTSY